MTSLAELRERFLATSTISMPLAGLIVWSALGVAALFVPKAVVGWMAVYVMAAILPLAFAIERLRGRNPFVKDDNPISKLFFQSIIGIGLMFPLVIGAAEAAGDPNLLVLGVAILAASSGYRTAGEPTIQWVCGTRSRAHSAAISPIGSRR